MWGRVGESGKELKTFKVNSRVSSLPVGGTIDFRLCGNLQVRVVKVGKQGKMIRSNGMGEDCFSSWGMAAGPSVMQDIIQSARVGRAVTSEFKISVLPEVSLCQGRCKAMVPYPLGGLQFHWADVMRVESCVEVTSYKAWLACFLSSCKKERQVGPDVLSESGVTRRKVGG